LFDSFGWNDAFIKCHSYVGSKMHSLDFTTNAKKKGRCGVVKNLGCTQFWVVGIIVQTHYAKYLCEGHGRIAWCYYYIMVKSFRFNLAYSYDLWIFHPNRAKNNLSDY